MKCDNCGKVFGNETNLERHINSQTCFKENEKKRVDIEDKCEYGCGDEAKWRMKNGKLCCSEHYQSCPKIKKKNSNALKKRIKTVGKILRNFMEIGRGIKI